MDLIWLLTAAAFFAVSLGMLKVIEQLRTED